MEIKILEFPGGTVRFNPRGEVIKSAQAGRPGPAKAVRAQIKPIRKAPAR